MRTEPVPGLSLSPNPGCVAYLSDFDRVAPAYEYDWTRQDSYARRAAHLTGGGYRGDRVALAAALDRFNRALDADESALRSIDLLRRESALAVVTGQQAGIFTGPAYSIYKAVTAIRLARRQSERLGLPVVPVFWIAGEDHDWQEVASVLVPAGDTVQRLALTESFSEERRSVALAPAPPSLTGLIDQLEGLLPPTEFTPVLMERMRSALADGPALDPALTDGQASLADWFGRLMAWLFAGTGLCFVNSADPALRRLQADFLADAILRHESVDAALLWGIETWAALGFTPTALRNPGGLNLFTYIDGDRLPLSGADDRTWIRGQESLSWSRAELVHLARTEPERFSTNVVLRPVVQGYLLPDLAYVGGPGEITYLGLYRAVYQAMGQQAPVFYPREGFTLIEPPIARILEKQGLTLADVLFRLDERKQELLDREDRLGISGLFDRFRGDFDQRYAGLTAGLLQLDGQLAQVIEENRKQIQFQIQKLEEKARQQHRKNCEVSLRQFERLRAHLNPGGLQERSVSILPYVAKYGPDLVQRLVEQVELPERWCHRALYLGE